MGNFDDSINDTSEFFSSADNGLYDFNGNKIGTAPANINPSFLIWWDGDLEREILSRTTILKYDAAKGEKKNLEGFSAVHCGDKDAPALSVDLLGDWREEICYPTEDNGTLRIFMTTYPTEYKIPTLLHDTQYREAIAWQNVGYNQPPHPKFYVGKAALADNGKYLAPAAGFDTVSMVGPEPAFVYPTHAEGSEGTFTVTVRAVGDVSGVISSQEVEGGSEYSYGYPRYILRDGFVYETSPNTTGAHFGATIANVTKDTTVKVTYTKKYSGVVYLEDIDKEVGSKGAGTRASTCLAQDNSSYTSDYILKPGITYTIVVGYQKSYRGSSFVADGKTLFTVTKDGEGAVAGTWGTYAIKDVTVENESPLSTVAGPNKTYDPLDTIVIINETAQAKEAESYDMTALEGTVLSVTGAASVSSDAVTITGVQNDDGNKKPSGYITFTAPAYGTLSLKFESSGTRTDGNLPRLYYCMDVGDMTKNNSSKFFQATGANAPLDVELNVTEGTTYYLFGYLYRYTSDFYYTIKDVSFKPAFLGYPITFKDYDGTVLITKDVAAGVIPDYDGIPQRDADDMYEYEFASWSPELHEVTGAAEYVASYTKKDREHSIVEVIGSYKDVVAIKKLTDSSGDAYLIITAESNIGELVLYSAVYDVDGRLVAVGSKKYNVDAGETRIDLTKPEICEGEAYKLMLWDHDNFPVIESVQ